jgi:hypothetical protein
MILEVRNSAPPGDAWHCARSLRLDVDLGHPAGCRLDERAPTDFAFSPRWDLETTDPMCGPFNQAFWWMGTEMADNVESPEAGDLDPVATRVFEHAARSAIARCDEQARRTASRMNRSARFFAYAALMAGYGSRVEQLIEICPAALTLAATCDPHRRGTVVLDAVRAGRKLGHIIECALQLGVRQCRRSTSELSRWATSLVRVAGNIEIWDLMLLLRSPGLDINDLPPPGPARTRWLALMTVWSRCAARRPCPDAVRLGSFLSRHALRFVDGHPEIAIDILLDWVDRADVVVPGRTTSPARVRAAIDAWHRTGCWDLTHPAETRLARGPTGIAVPEFEVRAIETVGELQAEGAEMEHCVFSLADEAIAGTTFLYAARISGARITISVGGERNAWYLQQVTGVRNRALEPEELRLVQRWVRSLT